MKYDEYGKTITEKNYYEGFRERLLTGLIIGTSIMVVLYPESRNPNPPAIQESQQIEETHTQPFTQSELPDKLNNELRLK